MAKIDFVADNTLVSLIEGFARVNGLDRSEAIRTLIAAGGSNLIMVDMQNKFDVLMEKINSEAKANMPAWINDMDNMVFRRDNHCCRRCHSKSNIQIHNIDGNYTNRDWSNQITLCGQCRNDYDYFIRHKDNKGKFIEWFFGVPKL